MDAEVIVVGAGPAGLMLACELRLWGVSTVVVEGRTERDERLRAQGLTRVAALALERHGLLAGLAGGPEPLAARYPAGLPAVLPGIPQQRVELALEERAGRLGVDLRRGCEVVAVRPELDQVTVELRALNGPGSRPAQMSGRYLVGCDGSHSLVRQGAGFATSGTAPRVTGYQALVTVTAPQPAPLPPGTHRTRTGVVSWRPGPCRIVSIEFTTPPEREVPVTLDEVQNSLRRTTGMALTLTAPRSIARFTDATRLVSAYRLGRVLLAGDAAHVHPPNGGQGLNLALTDALNLGWKLAATVQGWSPPGLLDTYGSERRPVAARAIRNALADMLLIDPDERMTPAYELYAELKNSDRIRPHLFDLISMVDLVYDIGVPPGRGHRLLGRTMGDLLVRTARGAARLATLQHGGRGLLLDLAGRAGVRASAALWADRVDTIDATCDDADVDALLVRPDGCAVWVLPPDGTAQPGDLTTALRTWFGRPGAAGRTEGGTA